MSSFEDLLAARARMAAIFFRFISAIMFDTGLRSFAAVGAGTLVTVAGAVTLVATEGAADSTGVAEGAGLTFSSCFLAPSSRPFIKAIASF